MTNGPLAANRPLTQRSAWTRAVGAVAVLFVVNLVALELLMLTSTLAHWSSDVHTRAEVAFGSAIIGEVAFLALLIWWLHGEHLTLDELGLQKRPKAWTVLVAVAFAVVNGLLTASNPGLRSNLGLHDFLKAEAVVAAVVAGIGGCVPRLLHVRASASTRTYVAADCWIRLLPRIRDTAVISRRRSKAMARPSRSTPSVAE